MRSLTEKGVPAWRERRCVGGVQFFNRASGLNLLLDEVRVPQRDWALAPRFVSIALTNACDLRCHHCYAPKRPARLATNCLQQWLRELDANGCLGVGFGGGEPTLHPDFASLCRFTAVETGLALTFTTHGHHLTDALVEQLCGHVHFIRVSMDGVGRTYEKVRGRPFSQLLGRLRSISQRISFGINFVVNARTISDLDDAVTYAAELGAAEFLLLPERPTSTSSGVDVQTLLQLESWIHRYNGQVPLTISEAEAPSATLFTPAPGEEGLRAYVHVDASGVMKRTSFDDGGVQIGQCGIIDAFTQLQSRTVGSDT